MSLDRCLYIAKTYPENTLLALVDDQVVGFSSYNKSSDGLENTGEIFALYIIEKFQGLGIGKRLMTETLERLKKL